MDSVDFSFSCLFTFFFIFILHTYDHMRNVNRRFEQHISHVTIKLLSRRAQFEASLCKCSIVLVVTSNKHFCATLDMRILIRQPATLQCFIFSRADNDFNVLFVPRMRTSSSCFACFKKNIQYTKSIVPGAHHRLVSQFAMNIRRLDVG